MNKKKITTKHILIMIIVLIMIIIAIFSFTLKEDKQLNRFESLIKDTVTSIEKVVFYPFRLVINKVNDYRELKDIRTKYQQLLPETNRIDSLKTENIELRKQLEALKKELNIDYTLNEYTYLFATVINRNVSNWYNTITIDKGTYNGVTKDMVVVNSQGLIGKVVATSTFTSDIRLITTSNTSNKISITISNGNNKVNGLIKKYNYKLKQLEVEGVSNTKSVAIGDYVYTSGLGEIFPSGILIGTVSEITTDEYDLSKIIKVTPSADFNDLNYVTILKRKDSNNQ